MCDLFNVINLQLSSLPLSPLSLSFSHFPLLGLHPLQNSHCPGQRGDRLLLLEGDCLQRHQHREWISTTNRVLTITFIFASAFFTHRLTDFLAFASSFPEWRRGIEKGGALVRFCVTPFTIDCSIWDMSSLTRSSTLKLTTLPSPSTSGQQLFIGYVEFRVCVRTRVCVRQLNGGERGFPLPHPQHINAQENKIISAVHLSELNRFTWFLCLKMEEKKVKDAKRFMAAY